MLHYDIVARRDSWFAGRGDGTLPENRPGKISGAIAAMSMHPRCICHPSVSISIYEYVCMFVYISYLHMH